MNDETTRSPWHEGERTVQEWLGSREIMDRVGPHVVRSFMPDQHRELFGKLPYFVVATLDAGGAPWATIVTGPPGFVATPDDHTLVFSAAPTEGDPVLGGLVVGAPVGLLGIELATRRRNRVNGVVAAVEPHGFTVTVQQSFGNCPQYIQTRDVIASASRVSAPTQVEGGVLSVRAVEILRRADTTFLASRARAADVDGIDVSHRGGKPGFLRVDHVDGATVVTMPDFAGNNFFMSLGNVVADPRVGLLAVDFQTGDLLSLHGAAEIVWGGAEVEAFAGAERLVRIRISDGRLFPGRMPFHFGEAGLAKQLTKTGAWR